MILTGFHIKLDKIKAAPKVLIKPSNETLYNGKQFSIANAIKFLSLFEFNNNLITSLGLSKAQVNLLFI